MKSILFLVGILACSAITDGRPRDRPSRTHHPRFFDAVGYLRRFHYLGAGNPDPRIAELARTNMSMAMEVGVKMFQMKWDMPVTGVLDQATVHKMQEPRCGMPDIEVMEDMPNMDTIMGRARERVRNRRYMIQGSSWDRATDTLYYRISEYTPDLSQNNVDREIESAFKLWSDVTPLHFIQVDDGHVDIDIRFTPAVHGDGFDFDGPGGVLAHAFYPQFGGSTHFDDGEIWTINTYAGINLLQVAAHEFGHALGLRHSEISEALMAPFYAGYIPDFTLPADDRFGIQAIYGPREEESTPPPMTPPPGMPDMCADGVFDAITTQHINGESITHVFRDEYYMQINPYGMVDGFPRLISSDWPGVHRVDAALTMEFEMNDNGVWHGHRMVTYLFSGHRYYKFINMDLVDEGFIGADWGLPDNLDAIFQWSANGKVYAIKGDDVYTISSITDKFPDSDSPRSLWNDWGLDHVDGAFMATNGDQMRDTILFSGNRYYKIDDTQRVAAGYPKSTPEGWLGCHQGDTKNILYPYLESESYFKSFQ